MKIKLLTLTLMVWLAACSKDEKDPDPTPAFISAVDISAFPEIELTNPVFYNSENKQEEFLIILKNSGVNTIRLRLWVNPANGHSGFEEVRAFSQRLRNMGFRIWLSVHYSDTWADPGYQETPAQWQGIAFAALLDSVRHYTQRIVEQIKPEYIQTGNEINPGFLHPYGNIFSNPQQFKDLLGAAIQAVRDTDENTKIILHYAGTGGALPFFTALNNFDYDIIGISYYPLWHGKDTGQLRQSLQNLASSSGKQILIAETAYPFTLAWNDWTNNIVGLEEQLILPQFPATPEGQREFMQLIRKIITEEVDGGIGFCYWGAELIAWKGPQASDASPWENQALFDFNNKALPVLEVFDFR
jgi:arabinogalactan endo-1,4-beta-galactosidase